MRVPLLFWACMQRIVRTTCLYTELSGHALALNPLLGKVCPPYLANLFASSRKGADGRLEWWSALEGQAVPFRDLPEDRQQQLLTLLEQRKRSLAYLAQSLATPAQQASRRTLDALLREVNPERLYEIGNQPVIVDWHLLDPDKVVSDNPITPEASSHVAGAGTAAALTMKNRKACLWGLLLLLLLAALLFLLWWLWSGRDGPDSSVGTETGKSPIANYVCSKQETISQVPDFVTVFDTSGSMRLNIAASAEDEQWVVDTNALYDPFNLSPRRLQLLSEPTREQVARQAYEQMLSSLHPDINTRLITFKGCQELVDHGLYRNEQREQLMQQLKKTGANDGTPLAASLRLAASKVDGVKNDAMIILFIDGEDGCGENICAVSEWLGKVKPRLQINVVDVSGNGLSRCVADATNGRLYSSREINELKHLFVDAAKEFSDISCE